MTTAERALRTVGRVAYPPACWREHGDELVDCALESGRPGREALSLARAGVVRRITGAEDRTPGWWWDGVRVGVMIALVLGFAAAQAGTYVVWPRPLAWSTPLQWAGDACWLAAIGALSRRRDALAALLMAFLATTEWALVTANGDIGVGLGDTLYRDVPGGVVRPLTIALAGLAAAAAGVAWRGGPARTPSWWATAGALAAPFAIAAAILPLDAVAPHTPGALTGPDVFDVRSQAFMEWVLPGVPFAAAMLVAALAAARSPRDPRWALGCTLALALYAVMVPEWLELPVTQLGPRARLMVACLLTASVALGAVCAWRRASPTGRAA